MATTEDILDIIYLKDEKKKTFVQISKLLSINYTQCRKIYLQAKGIERFTHKHTYDQSVIRRRYLKLCAEQHEQQRQETLERQKTDKYWLNE